jgi:integrase
VLSAAKLAREPRNIDVRGQRRPTAVALDPEAFALLPRLRALREQLLHMGAPSDRHEETAVVGAVLGTVVFSGITIPHLRETLVSLERDALEADAGCLTLPVSPASSMASGPQCQQRFALHPMSLLHWGRLLLCRPQDVPESSAPTQPLLPPAWRDPNRLRAALRVTLKTGGFTTWPSLLRTVRIEMLLTTQAPVSVLRCAGGLVTAAAPASDWHRLGWMIADPADVSDGGARKRALTPPDRRASDDRVAQVQIRRVVTALNSDTSGPERSQIAARLERLLKDPQPRDSDSAIARSIVRWAIHLLRRRRYRPNTVRTWLSRISRALHTVDPIPSLDDLRDPARLTAFIEKAIGSSVAIESRRAMRTALRQYLRFLTTKGVRVVAIRWSARRFLIPTEARRTSLLSPGEIRAVVEMVLRDRADGLALATAILLAGFGGLRRIEVCRLHREDVPRDRRWTICVRHSKTSAGRRAVALRGVLPPWAMAVLDRYAAWRADYVGVDPRWLLTQEGTPWDPDRLATRIILVLRRVTGKPVTFHSLRRAAATWLWVQSVLPTYDLELPPATTVDGPRPDGVRELLGDSATFGVWSLAGFLGHRSPAITLNRYLLAIDWFDAQLMRAIPDAPIPLRAAADALLVSNRRARQLLRARSGAVSRRALLTAQRDRLARERTRRQRDYAAIAQALPVRGRVPSSQDTKRGAA